MCVSSLCEVQGVSVTTSSLCRKTEFLPSHRKQNADCDGALPLFSWIEELRIFQTHLRGNCTESLELIWTRYYMYVCTSIYLFMYVLGNNGGPEPQNDSRTGSCQGNNRIRTMILMKFYNYE